MLDVEDSYVYKTLQKLKIFLYENSFLNMSFSSYVSSGLKPASTPAIDSKSFDDTISDIALCPVPEGETLYLAVSNWGGKLLFFKSEADKRLTHLESCDYLGEITQTAQFPIVKICWDPTGNFVFIANCCGDIKRIRFDREKAKNPTTSGSTTTQQTTQQKAQQTTQQTAFKSSFSFGSSLNTADNILTTIKLPTPEGQPPRSNFPIVTGMGFWSHQDSKDLVICDCNNMINIIQPEEDSNTKKIKKIEWTESKLAYELRPVGLSICDDEFMVNFTNGESIIYNNTNIDKAKTTTTSSFSSTTTALKPIPAVTEQPFNSIVFSKNKFYAMGSISGIIELRTIGKEKYKAIPCHRNITTKKQFSSNCLAISADKQLIASGGGDGSIAIIWGPKAKLLGEIPPHNSSSQEYKTQQQTSYYGSSSFGTQSHQISTGSKTPFGVTAITFLDKPPSDQNENSEEPKLPEKFTIAYALGYDWKYGVQYYQEQEKTSKAQLIVETYNLADFKVKSSTKSYNSWNNSFKK